MKFFNLKRTTTPSFQPVFHIYFTQINNVFTLILKLIHTYTIVLILILPQRCKLCNKNDLWPFAWYYYHDLLYLNYVRQMLRRRNQRFLFWPEHQHLECRRTNLGYLRDIIANEIYFLIKFKHFQSTFYPNVKLTLTISEEYIYSERTRKIFFNFVFSRILMATWWLKNAWIIRHKFPTRKASRGWLWKVTTQ